MVRLSLKFYILGTAILLTAVFIDYAAAKTTFFVLDPIKYEPIAEITIAREVKAETPEEDIKDWILDEWEKVGQRDEANAIITCESRWNLNAFNINSNGTIDLGLYQFNSLHLKSGLIDLKCLGDFKCQTKKAIEMWQKKGWTPWVCNKLVKL